MLLAQKLPTIRDVEALFHYDSATGELTWKAREFRGSATHAGKRAGSVRIDGYRSVKINMARHLEHRVCWVFISGSPVPEGMFVDHINGDRADNRAVNLRLATRAQNNANRRPKPGLLKGAYPSRSPGKFESTIRANGKPLFLGTFSTAEEAHAAYVLAADIYHGEFARVE